MTKKKPTPIVIIDSPDHNNDLLYATKFSAPDAIAYIERGRKRWLIVNSMEYNRAKEETSGIEVLTHAQLFGPRSRTKPPYSNLAATVALLRREKIRRISVPANFPLLLARQLEEKNIRVDATNGEIFPQRAVKVADEIDNLRQSQTAAVAAMTAAKKQIKKASVRKNGNLYDEGGPLTSERIRETIEQELLKHCCSADRTIVACGSTAADPHAVGTGPLKVNEFIVIDIFPRSKEHGYWGDITRTYIKGSCSDEKRKMYESVYNVQMTALEKVSPRTDAAGIHKMAQEMFKDSGFANKRCEDGGYEGFIHGTGHGVGLDIHEFPRVGGKESRLRSGNVITIEPGLYYRDLGGVRIEDTVVVTKTGFDYLKECPKRFEDIQL